MLRSSLAAQAICVWLALWMALPSIAATYIVDRAHSASSDSNAGTDRQLPWKTIQKAADTVVAGDIVIVVGGTTNVYPERVSETTDGSAGNFITYIGESYPLVTGGWQLTGSDYVRLIGFAGYHTNTVSLGYDWCIVSGQHCEILNNVITNVSQAQIAINGAHWIVIRGNTMRWSGSPGDTNGPGFKAVDDSGMATNVLGWYNNMGENTDDWSPWGTNHIYQYNVLGPTTTNYVGGLPHVDGMQSGAEGRRHLLRYNWHVGNSVRDSHLCLVEQPVSGRIDRTLVYGNVSLRSGDELWYQMRDGTNLYCAFNSVGQVGYSAFYSYLPPTSGFINVRDGSINNESYNNIFTNCVRSGGTGYLINSGTALTHNHDLFFPAVADITGGSNGDLEVDPKFVDYAANNLMLQAGSPCIDAGGPLTKVTTASGTGTSFTVNNPDWFADPLVVGIGDDIYVGDDNNLRITAVNYSTRTLTVSASFTWTTNDDVGRAYTGAGPDMGAYEFGAVFLTAASASHSGSDYTCTPVGDCRMVIFYQNGIPHTAKLASPWTATISSGTVTAEAFALWPQSNMVAQVTMQEPAGGSGIFYQRNGKAGRTSGVLP